jgi:hypothetical protein
VRGLVAPELRHALPDGAVAEPLISALDHLPKGATDLDCMLYLEGKCFPADHNLNYTDNMSMPTVSKCAFRSSTRILSHLRLGFRMA